MTEKPPPFSDRKDFRGRWEKYPEAHTKFEANQASPLSPDLLQKIETALKGLESILQEMKSEGVKSTSESNAGYGYSPLDDVLGAIGMLSNALG